MSSAMPKVAIDKLKRLSPLFNRVLIKRDDPLKQTPGGIVLPEDTKERILKGVVVAVGPGARNEHGNNMPMTVKPGDEVILPDYGGTKIQVEENQVYFMFRETDILAKLN